MVDLLVKVCVLHQLDASHHTQCFVLMQNRREEMREVSVVDSDGGRGGYLKSKVLNLSL